MAGHMRAKGEGVPASLKEGSGEQHKAAGGEQHMNNHAHHCQKQRAGMAVNTQHCKVQLAGTGMAVKASIR